MGVGPRPMRAEVNPEAYDNFFGGDFPGRAMAPGSEAGAEQRSTESDHSDIWLLSHHTVRP